MSKYKKCKYFCRKEIKKNTNLLRICVIITNTINVILYGVYLKFALSENYTILTQIFDIVKKREDQNPFLTLNMRENCFITEETLPIYRWPGTNPGCVCQTHP